MQSSRTPQQLLLRSFGEARAEIQKGKIDLAKAILLQAMHEINAMNIEDFEKEVYVSQLERQLDKLEEWDIRVIKRRAGILLNA